MPGKLNTANDYLFRIQRSGKDAAGTRDLHRYHCWKKLAEDYGSERAKQVLEELKAKWPGKSFE